ncbi:MAG TPA: serine protease [Solirubrobacteraceae bacterium]|nr:serine protease [Solirubrobacteraceae bacterium]
MPAPPTKILGTFALAVALALASAGSAAAAGARAGRHYRVHSRHHPVQAAGPPAAQVAGSPAARTAIVDGAAAEASTFPWLAVIFHEGEGEAFQCTGTVVSPNVILTAAHCVEDPRSGDRYTASGYFVVTGTVDWTQTTRQVLGVSTTVVYPAFNRLVASGDAALLVLSTPTTAPAVPLASRTTDAAFLAPGHRALMAGWGETFPGGPVPHELHWAATSVQSARYCRGHTRVFVPSDELCTLDSPARRAVACFGDSGGPLLGALPSTGEVVELGVASHLYTECQAISPVVYTRADLIRTWVQEWIASASYLPGTLTPASATPTVVGAARSAQATPGLYGAHLATGQAITLHVAGNGEWITEVAATVRLACGRGATITAALGWPAEALFISGGAASATLPISPAGRLRGGTATLSASFTAQGTLQGQLHIRAAGATRRLGSCTAQLAFTATP